MRLLDGATTMYTMFDSLEPCVIRAAGKLSDRGVVMDDGADVMVDRLHSWACNHLDAVTRSIQIKLGARAAWTHTIDRRTSAALLALADVAQQRAATDLAAAESWRGQIDDDIVDEWRDQGLAEVGAREAAELVAAARGSSDAPVAAMVLLDLLIRLASFVRPTGRSSPRNAHVRLRRLPHLALSPRLLARPRARRALITAA